MTKIDDLFEKCEIADLKEGYTEDIQTDEYVCLICGARYSKAEIYPYQNRFLVPEGMMKVHIETEHGSPLKHFLSLDKKLSGISEQQTRILESLTKGKTDREIAQEIGDITESTVRNHRFNLREKARQSRIFLAIMSSVEDYIQEKKKFVSIQRYAGNIDERYQVTTEEDEKTIAKFMNCSGKIIHYPKKEKDRLSLLRKIMEKFESNKKYHENEVNDLLRPVYEDYVLLRRLLIEYKFLDRTADGKEYWVK